MPDEVVLGRYVIACMYQEMTSVHVQTPLSEDHITDIYNAQERLCRSKSI